MFKGALIKYVCGILILPLMLITALPASYADAARSANTATNPDEAPRITVEGLKAKLAKGERVVILDVRARGAYDKSAIKIKGAQRIPPDELKERLTEIPMGREIITYCT